MARGGDLPFACDCGKITGTLIGAGPATGTRIECFCGDCRDAELYAHQPAPAPGAVQLWQTTPDRVRIHTGHEHLRVFSLSPRGILRWQAGCCGAILGNTPRSMNVPFVGFRTDRLADPAPLGKIVAQAFVPQKDGNARSRMSPIIVFRMLIRMATVRLSGRHKDTPFFDATGAPARKPFIIPKEERTKLR